MSDRSETDVEPGRTGPYDHSRWDDPDGLAPAVPDESDLELARENVLEDWPRPERPDADHAPADPAPDEGRPAGMEPPGLDGLAAEPSPRGAAEPEPVSGAELEPPGVEEPAEPVAEHAPGALVVPPGVPVLEGAPNGARRAVGIVVARFNGDVTSRLLASALDELERAGVAPDAITVMPVPGAFELPLGAMALAKTRRFSGVIALGCVVRGDTPHFDYVAGEAASGIQLAALETGVPVAFGVLTLESADQAETRIDKGAEAVRTVLEMADLFANLRAAAAQ